MGREEVLAPGKRLPNATGSRPRVMRAAGMPITSKKSTTRTERIAWGFDRSQVAPCGASMLPVLLLTCGGDWPKQETKRVGLPLIEDLPKHR